MGLKIDIILVLQCKTYLIGWEVKKNVEEEIIDIVPKYICELRVTGLC